MNPEYRNKKIENKIRGLISEGLQKIKVPEIDALKSYIVISRVLVSKDKRFADVFVSYIGDADSRKRAVELLEKYKGFFRKYIAQNLRIYTTPELRFKEDIGIEESIRINKLLDEISKNNKNISDK
ncbi:ribosome-binding factor A [Thermosipho melanesiensis]|uniref:Ribosome-binding factor A n=2 Tax=Thermosipho melanesiensis TaxID=46541 RepID=RBFA_THEM4|nr:30S ribosome-binding factor RbfA [Thermosipho melanesiensis]A6LN42.1 RecName: Full=Ribosome-binding factor A [Thermosipho melanesiensis BI429]ABR31343.1 ribosome-binding factor A [Thermosipho melanesiensis BI429]APT74403.1 ribosome-binding factor A [Thermosipho melanesiensis]OOC36366.1 ribosome-binding factor A [Thermosipho melanesiensis]OOC37184.1 ribosome-binding factor A [Thermosipho melanesiensis]OOC37936.1 ribosome-binding factor A [Thermosipho melanesiensis]